MTVNNDFPTPPQNPRAELSYIRKLMISLLSAMSGKLNCTGEVTLTPSAGTTTVKDPLCNENSVVMMYPQTANAAAVVASTYAVPGDKEFVITHPNNANTDKDFRYVIIG